MQAPDRSADYADLKTNKGDPRITRITRNEENDPQITQITRINGRKKAQKAQKCLQGKQIEKDEKNLYRGRYVEPDRISSDEANVSYKVIYCAASLD